MIRVEYDVPTNGPRVSFVLREGLNGIPDVTKLLTNIEWCGDVLTAPQTPENLEAIKYLAYFGSE
jgi:hypothetical protein